MVNSENREGHDPQLQVALACCLHPIPGRAVDPGSGCRSSKSYLRQARAPHKIATIAKESGAAACDPVDLP